MRKRSVTISGHATSITLEDAFWAELKEIAQTQGLSLNRIISQIDDTRRNKYPGHNLSSALRLYILEEVKKQRHP